MPWRPSVPGEVPTLGFAVIDWITENLAAPDRAGFEPFRLYPEQAQFVLRFYELDPVTGRRKRRRGVISRPRGWGKSPFLAALAIVEALADVVPDGWDANGQPVGKPWSEVRTPLVQIAAVAEAQTKNTWRPLLEMLEKQADDGHCLQYHIIGTKGAIETDVFRRRIRRWEFSDSPERLVSKLVEKVTYTSDGDNEWIHNVHGQNVRILPMARKYACHRIGKTR